MMFLKPVKQFWRPGQVPDLDLFVSFSEVAELEAERYEDPTPHAFMSMFTRLILNGTFDAKPLGPLPFVELMVIDQSIRHMLIPLYSPPAPHGPDLRPLPPSFLGFGCANSEDIPRYLADAYHWFRNGPERKTGQELDAFANEILASNFEDLPDAVQGALGDIIIAKENLKHWYDMRNTYVPWPAASNDNRTETDFPARSPVPPGSEGPSRGRPEKPGWDFIRMRARELKRLDGRLLNKEIAGLVTAEARSKFGAEDTPCESTVVKEMRRILGRK